MFALRRRAIGVSAALVAAASLTASLLISTAQAQTPSITSIVVSDITMTTATVTVNLADANDGTYVYLKYGPVNTYNTNPEPPAYNVGNEAGQNRWLYVYDDADPLQATTTSGAATFDLPDSALPQAKLASGIQPLWAAYEVNVEASLDDTFQTGVETQTFKTLPPMPEVAWVDGTQTQMALQVSLSSLSGEPQTVYYRWREVGAATWNTGTVVVPWGNPQTETYRLMTGLTSHTQYEAEASLDPNFPTDKTVTETAWTHEPFLVRMGVHWVTEEKVVFTGLMNSPNDQVYDLACQTQPAGETYWSAEVSGQMNDHVGAATKEGLDADEDYNYRCWLKWDVGPFGPNGRKLPVQATQTLDGTATALTKIEATISGTTATITVTLVNTDGSNNDVYLRYRVYPNEEWSFPAGKGTTTDTAVFTTGITSGDLHEFEASLDQNFADEKKVLTLYLAEDSPATPPPPEPETETETETETNNPNNGGTDPNNNGNNGNSGGTNFGGNTNSGNSGGGFGGSGASRNNSPPNFRDSAKSDRSVPENSVEDVKVGGPILAWDPENDKITFSLQGDDAAPFKIEPINSYSAQLLVGPDAGLDYEDKNVYLVDVVAKDGASDATIINIRVDLVDVKLPGRADEFDVANNHDEHLDREEVEAAHEAFRLQLLTWSEMAFVMDYYYTTNFPAIDLDNVQGMVNKYDLNQDDIIDSSEVLSALEDFLSGAISKAELQEIVKVHFTTTMADTPSDEAPAAT